MLETLYPLPHRVGSGYAVCAWCEDVPTSGDSGTSSTRLTHCTDRGVYCMPEDMQHTSIHVLHLVAHD